MADGDVQAYTVNLEYEDGTVFSLGTTTDTSKTVKTNQLQPGKYRLHVGAAPIGGGEEDILWSEILFAIPKPEPTQEPTPEPTREPEIEQEPERILYIDASSPEGDILKMQMALYTYGLLDTDNAQQGVLDVFTLEAVAAFQQKMNETFGVNLMVIDPYAEDVFIDEITLDYLIYQSMDF